jgi:hypothetical protein
MPEQTVELFQGFSAIAPAVAGVLTSTVTIQFGPYTANESWDVEHQSLSNPGPLIPEVLVYKNVVAPSGFIEGTLNGINGMSDTSISLMRGEVLYYVWTNCSPGTLCQVTVRGTKDYAI